VRIHIRLSQVIYRRTPIRLRISQIWENPLFRCADIDPFLTSRIQKNTDESIVYIHVCPIHDSDTYVRIHIRCSQVVYRRTQMRWRISQIWENPLFTYLGVRIQIRFKSYTDPFLTSHIRKNTDKSIVYIHNVVYIVYIHNTLHCVYTQWTHLCEEHRWVHCVYTCVPYTRLWHICAHTDPIRTNHIQKNTDESIVYIHVCVLARARSMCVSMSSYIRP